MTVTVSFDLGHRNRHELIEIAMELRRGSGDYAGGARGLAVVCCVLGHHVGRNPGCARADTEWETGRGPAGNLAQPNPLHRDGCTWELSGSKSQGRWAMPELSCANVGVHDRQP